MPFSSAVKKAWVEPSGKLTILLRYRSERLKTSTPCRLRVRSFPAQK